MMRDIVNRSSAAGSSGGDQVANDTRTRMIAGAAQLLSTRGLEGTSFAELVEATGAPRGSIYHHFPGGKDELLVEAVRYVGGGVLRQLARRESPTPLETAQTFTAMWRRVLVGSDMAAGCAVAAAAIGTGAAGSAVFDAAAGVFRQWSDALAERFTAGGLDPVVASELAVTLVAGMEGALLLARAERSIAPFDAVARRLEAMVATA